MVNYKLDFGFFKINFVWILVINDVDDYSLSMN